MSRPRIVPCSILLIAVLLAGACPRTVGAADSPDDQSRQLRELQEKVAKLEGRLAELEKRVGPVVAKQANDQDVQARAKKQQLLARQRMSDDLKKHNRKQLQEAEQLYQVANKDWRSPEAKQSLQQMVERFPDVNRTGCAALYLAQWAEGDERERLLKEAGEKYGDCFYGNGVQVGPYSKFLLALYYKDKGEADKAKELFEEIRTKHAEAIDHRGNGLVGQIPV
jgi:hypothetical protein